MSSPTQMTVVDNPSTAVFDWVARANVLDLAPYMSQPQPPTDVQAVYVNGPYITAVTQQDGNLLINFFKVREGMRRVSRVCVCGGGGQTRRPGAGRFKARGGTRPFHAWASLPPRKLTHRS